jgi:hypothetical protein
MIRNGFSQCKSNIVSGGFEVEFGGFQPKFGRFSPFLKTPNHKKTLHLEGFLFYIDAKL